MKDGFYTTVVFTEPFAKIKDGFGVYFHNTQGATYGPYHETMWSTDDDYDIGQLIGPLTLLEWVDK